MSEARSPCLCRGKGVREPPLLLAVEHTSVPWIVEIVRNALKIGMNRYGTE